MICIDPPFAKNQTFTGSLKPPLSDAERQREADTLAGWGIHSRYDAGRAGIEWPDADNTGRFSDIWRWEEYVHEDWITRIDDDYPALAKVIETSRTAYDEGTAAYLAYMAIRIIEMQRVLKETGGIYLRCDTTASHYLKTERPLLNPEANIITRGPGELPIRTDEDPVERQDIKDLSERKFKVSASRIPERDMMEFLLDLSGYTAWCCGFANRRSSGEVVRTTNNFHLDHIDPKSKQGSNQVHNRAPLCPTHNIRKNNRRIHLEEYRAEIADAGEMLVDTMAELVDLAWAQQQAIDFYAWRTGPSFHQAQLGRV